MIETTDYIFFIGDAFFDDTKKTIIFNKKNPDKYKPIKIGSDSKSDILIKELPKFYSIIEIGPNDNSIVIYALEADMPVIVNGNPITKCCQLKVGDIVKFSDKIYLKFENIIIKKEAKEQNKKLKIYVTAAHSCGKSTLARYISAKYDLPLIFEVARTILSEKELSLKSLRTNLDIVDDYQWSVFERQIEEEKKYDSFVSDRCFDFITYSAQHATIAEKIFNDSRFINYIKSLKENNIIIFFVRPNMATLHQDGVRENPIWDGIIAIDAQLKFILEIYGIRYFQINSDSLQERTNLIDNILSLI